GLRTTSPQAAQTISKSRLAAIAPRPGGARRWNVWVFAMIPPTGSPAVPRRSALPGPGSVWNTAAASAPAHTSHRRWDNPPSGIPDPG
ncbi:hypothetical protein LLOABG_LLOABG_05235, partial [Dysosmobacter welbionis]